jgi:tetratricopeptide (TPR) repeat protein
VTYGGLLQERRKTLHAQIVSAIERLYADRLSEQVERLAHHALRGALWEKAVRYGRQSGKRALGRSALKDALAHFEQAQVALQELPEGRERTEQLIDLYFQQHIALIALAEFARVGELMSEARTLAEGLGDQRRLGQILAYQANVYDILGEFAEALAAGEEALHIAEVVGDLRLRVRANFFLGLALYNAGNPRRAAQSLRAAIALLQEAPLGQGFGLLAGSVRHVLVVALAELGKFVEAIAVGEEGLRIAQAAGHAYSEVWVRHGLGMAHLRRGDFAQAAQVVEPGLALCRAMENRLALPFVAATMGSAHLWSGRTTEAVPLLEEAVEAITAMRSSGYRSFTIFFLSEAHLMVGRVAEAREQAEQAMALTRTHPHRGWEAWALKLLGDIHAHVPVEIDQSGAKQAGDAYRRALTLATELGMRPLVAQCHFGLAKLYRRTNKREQAQEHFTTATTMYREMGMQYWLEQAQDKMKELA